MLSVPLSVLDRSRTRVGESEAATLRATVSTFPTSGYDLGQLLTALGIGEAVVTVLSERGAPTPVAWTRLRAPLSINRADQQAKDADSDTPITGGVRIRRN